MIDWPEGLVNAIARRRVVVLLGSDVSASCISNNGGRRPPTWGEFLRSAADRCNDDRGAIRKKVASGDYLSACELAKDSLQEDGWRGLIREEFVAPGYQPSDLVKAIYRLGHRITITPNFDKIYDTYASAESQNTVLIKHYSDNDISDAVREGQDIIIKAHGTVGSIGSMIFSRSDYIKHKKNNANFIILLESIASTHTVLMIGCGVSDPGFALLFENCAAAHVGRPHYMTWASYRGDTKDIELMLRTRNVKCLKYRPKDGHKELVQSIIALITLVEQKRTIMGDGQDW
ncbi:MAG: SIR2 family protein [Glycocaulis sp.]